MSAAERVKSLQESVEEAQRRLELRRMRSQQALLAEDTFVERFASKGYLFTRESEQRMRAQLLGHPTPQTPDMGFTSPVVICGQQCNWVEFKDYFGFPDNPFVARKEKKQLRKYLLAVGQGAVVHTIGFQCGYPNIEGVAVLRCERCSRD
ncbi:hypothetical protein G647_10300 [Cladophialophora carrionii CBS 160.54]|uniref:Uncharacterized protein n=1 Tax=Cladophialophora carrionii CBS 160.54 TaxID=1279043 RepID=V9DIX9_9EURO|nr:uncharacterized protein G647_10300 [Cladophialophora carrionii CBS 160.54]ETI26854.1 hypothetical protein G647_10300 [Cladophialophora carrionii CBS 160.54]